MQLNFSLFESSQAFPKQKAYLLPKSPTLLPAPEAAKRPHNITLPPPCWSVLLLNSDVPDITGPLSH